MGNLGGLVKKLRDIMRSDPGINGDAQRIEQIVWMLFLKVYDAKEEDWEMEDAYASVLPEKYRWRNWAHEEKAGDGLTGDDLLDFVGKLFKELKELALAEGTTIRESIVKSVFEDANQYMKDGVLLRQMVNVIDAIDLGSYENIHALGDIYESILKELQSKTYAEGTVEQKLSDLYKLAMDSARREQDGLEPVMPVIRRLEAAKKKKQLFDLQLEMMPYGETEFFGIYLGADDKNASQNIVNIGQSGLTLGLKDYYLETDSATTKIREGYKQHIVRMFRLFGFKEKAGFSAAAEAATAPSVNFSSSAPTAPSGEYMPGTARQEGPGVSQSASSLRMTEPPDA